jgi:hypothetical protein
MRGKDRNTAQLGEMIAAVYDIAAHYSADPNVISRLTTRVVQGMLSTAVSTTKANSRDGKAGTVTPSASNSRPLA